MKQTQLNKELLTAVQEGQVEKLKALIERGADVDVVDAIFGMPAIVLAAKGKLEIVELLVEGGADVNAKDTQQETALTWAIEKENISVADYLISKGADTGHAGKRFKPKEINRLNPQLKAAIEDHNVKDIKAALAKDRTVTALEIVKSFIEQYAYQNVVECLIEEGVVFNSDHLFLALANSNLELEFVLEKTKTESPFEISTDVIEKCFKRFSENSEYQECELLLTFFWEKGVVISDELYVKILNGINYLGTYLFVFDRINNKKLIAEQILAKDFYLTVKELEKFLTIGINIKQIKELRLNDAEASIPPALLYDFEQLEILEIAYTVFKTLSADIRKLKNLKVLYLPESLISIPIELGEIPGLKTIKAYSQVIPALAQIDSLHIETLTLIGPSYDKVSDMPEEIGKFKTLVNLYALGRPINVAKEVAQLQNLKILALNDAHLETLPIEIAQMHNLETLDISGNKKLKLEKEFLSMKNLDKESMKEIKKRVAKDIDPAMSKVFAGQKWCVTGTFKNYKPREKALELIEAMGGLIGKSVDKTTTHLLAGDKAGDKIDKAEKLKITIVTETEFETLLKASPSTSPALQPKTILKDTTTRDKVVKAIQKIKWDCDVNYIISLLRHTISLTDDKRRITLGTSKIGGKPDLPKIMKWPFIYDEDEDGTVPLTFIAQFNISEMKPFDFDNVLPPAGMLYLFMYFLRDGTQDDYSGGGEAEWVKMFHYNGDIDELKPVTIPKKLKEADEDEYLVGILKESAIAFKEDYTLPGGDAETYASLEEQLSETDKENLQTLIFKTIPHITGGRTESQFFGFPQYVQSGSHIGKPEDDFPLFFQLSEALGDFGRCVADGAFYFTLSKQDITNADFRNIEANCQYT